MQENLIVISAQDIDFSASAEETLVCQYAGHPLSIGFKSTFLIDMLNNISADVIVIELADPSRAGVIIPVDVYKRQIVALSDAVRASVREKFGIDIHPEVCYHRLGAYFETFPSWG